MCGIVGLFLEKQGPGAPAGGWLPDAQGHERPRAGQRRLCDLWRGQPGTVKFTLADRPHGPAHQGFASRFGVPAPPGPARRPMRCSSLYRACSEGAVRRWLAEEHPDMRSGRRRHPHGALQGSRPARRSRRSLRSAGDDRHARHRPYAHGDRIRGHHRWRASFLDRRGPVSRA